VSRTEKFLSLFPGDIVSFIGGGGKTTLMNALATRLAREGRRVIVTATRPFAFRPGESPPLLPEAAGPGAFTASPGPLPGGLLAGFPPDGLPGPLAGFDYLLVEAEDARGASLPPPAETRPVPPATTVLCAMAGLDALGPALACRGFAGRLLAPGGLLGCREDLERRFLLLAKADGRPAREDGARILRSLVELAGPAARLPKVLLTSVRDFLRPVGTCAPGGSD
jgi:hypothetical protein